MLVFDDRILLSMREGNRFCKYYAEEPPVVIS